VRVWNRPLIEPEWDGPKKDLTPIFFCGIFYLLCEQVFVGIYRTAEAITKALRFFLRPANGSERGFLIVDTVQ
jgi:hypothetical protein